MRGFRGSDPPIPEIAELASFRSFICFLTSYVVLSYRFLCPSNVSIPVDDDDFYNLPTSAFLGLTELPHKLLIIFSPVKAKCRPRAFMALPTAPFGIPQDTFEREISSVVLFSTCDILYILFERKITSFITPILHSFTWRTLPSFDMVEKPCSI